MEVDRVVYHPIISSIQKIALYETKSVSVSNIISYIYVCVGITFQKFYLVGSNNTLTRFRVLKIDRMEPKELVIYDDKVEYTHDEIHNLVMMIEGTNRQRVGLSNTISAFGIIGKVN